MNALRAFWIFVAVWLALPLMLHAQGQRNYATLTGTVVDSKTGEPLPGANVFIAVSMIGTTTDKDGHFRLEPVPLGAHRLYVSMLGFEPSFKDINLRSPRVYPFNFKLDVKVLEVGEITVEAKGDKNWKKRLEKFTRLFIGETPNANKTKILNPEVLDFKDKFGHFEAQASKPLIIENRALGYRIQYFLKDFVAEPNRTRYDGEPLFEELEPVSPDETGLWKQNRRQAFIGSFHHFILALLQSRTKAQGFQTYLRPSNGPAGGGTFQQSSMQNQRYPLDPKTIIKPGEVPSERMLDFKGFVEIVFLGEKEDKSYLDWSKQGGIGRKPGYQKSWINLENGPTAIDFKGEIIDPYGVTLYGYFAFERVADELPKEYRPGR